MHWTEMRRSIGILSALLCVCGSAGIASAQPASPLVEGPVTGGLGQPFVAATMFDLGLVEYRQDEYFVSGTAQSFTSAQALTSDGRWNVFPDESADYKTRILVHRPIRRGKFNGTVIVEWLNVSGGLDAAPDWIMTHTELIRRGYAWVGVSAQFVGVEGGPNIGLPPMPIKEVDPERYGSLVHPGDSFSYDIFSQVAQSIRNPSGLAPLGDLRVRRVIAVGESQSAFRFVTYINGIHPLHRLYDGYLIHSRGGGGAALAQAPQTPVPSPNPSFIRTDIDVPVLTFETETDLTLLGFYRDRQPDSTNIRLWEVAGTAHADSYTTIAGPFDLGNDPSVMDLIITTEVVPGLITCPVPINSGPQQVVLRAAIHTLNRWVKSGRPPASAPRIDASLSPVITIARDALGNALGGIRTPWVDVPLASHSGGGQTGSILCILFGTSTPLDDEILQSLYPTAKSYRRAFRRSTHEGVRHGWIRKRDARLMKANARNIEIGN